MGDDPSRKLQADDLRARLHAVRSIKHQICNELMGAIGHAQLLEQQAELSEASRRRLARIREHCRNIAEQAEELTRICRED